MIKDLCLNQAPRARLSAAVNEHSTSDCSNAITHIIEADELTLILNNSVHYCTYYLNPNCKAAVLWIVNNEPQTPCALGEVLHTLLHFEIYLNGSFAINSVFGISGAHLIDYFFHFLAVFSFFCLIPVLNCRHRKVGKTATETAPSTKGLSLLSELLLETQAQRMSIYKRLIGLLVLPTGAK